ncbi:MAG TPA: YciI family protein [Spongiibacteraceae bacterium]|nr:YciI family protein [Spongiibacteraceae bacterium]
MKYLCLVYFEEKSMQAMSQSEWDALNNECLDCGDGLRASGHWLGGEALQSVDTATTVRVRNGKVTTTDGPFAETKEQLAGFYLLDARDLNEAIQLAVKIPPARYGSIEVRPIREVVTEGNSAYP